MTLPLTKHTAIFQTKFALCTANIMSRVVPDFCFEKNCSIKTSIAHYQTPYLKMLEII